MRVADIPWPTDETVAQTWEVTRGDTRYQLWKRVRGGAFVYPDRIDDRGRVSTVDERFELEDDLELQCWLNKYLGGTDVGG